MQLHIFNDAEFGELEVLMLDGKPYFPATDCAKLLGYKNPHKAINDHCPHLTKREVGVQTGIKAGGQLALQMVEKTYIPEGDLYRLIIRSKLPAAVRFEAWVCDCVLPSVRQSGAYITESTLEKMREDKSFTDSLVQHLSAERARSDALMEAVDQMLPKALYYDNILQSPNALPVSVIAKDYGMTAVAFNKLLHELGVQYRLGKVWLLYKCYADKGYTLSKTYIFDGEAAQVHTCWTQTGRRFLYDLLRWYGIFPVAERLTS